MGNSACFPSIYATGRQWRQRRDVKEVGIGKVRVSTQAGFV